MNQIDTTIRLAYDRGKGGESLEAKHGQFSEKFYRTVTASLRIAPGVVQHVVSLGGASGGSEPRVDGTREAPLPMSVQAFADVNEIYSILVYWTRVFAPSLHAKAPAVAVRSWRNMNGTILGLPSDVTASAARGMVSSMAAWLEARMDLICELDVEDVTAMRDSLKYIFQTDARWPQEAKPRYSDMPCPDDRCKGKIAVFPPREFGDDERIVCEGCGRHFMPDQYEHLIGLFKQLRAEQKTAGKVAEHLTRKYAS